MNLQTELGKLPEYGTVFWRGKKSEKGFGTLSTNTLDLQQMLLVRCHQVLQIAEMVFKKLCRYFADMTDSKGRKKFRQRRKTAGLNGIDDLLGRFFAPTVKLAKVFYPEPEYIRDVTNKLQLHQFFNRLSPKTFDIQAGFAGKMDKRLQSLRGAGGVGTAIRGFAFFPDQHRIAFWTSFGKKDLPLGAGSFFLNRHDDFRNDVSGPLDKHGVTDFELFPMHFSFIVQGGATDHNATNPHRIEHGNRGDRAGASDIEVNVKQAGRGLRGREFPGKSPARAAGFVAESGLDGKGIHLDDQAVDLIREIRREW